ncbi:hypothetical protein [Amycolatopsis sacchari]|uniref:hypothetical protein n=1 Tax=Amycolatopsis sacchari TaxID=115433 RepID=UPI003EBDE0C3
MPVASAGGGCAHAIRIIAVGLRAGVVFQGETGFGLGECGGVLVGGGVLPRGFEVPVERDHVDLLVGQGEAVAGGRAGDHVGTEQGARPGHEDLQRLGGVLGLVVGPQPFDEACRPAPAPQVGGQQGE